MAHLLNLASGEQDQVFFDFTTHLSGQQISAWTAYLPAGISAVTASATLSAVLVMFKVTGAPNSANSAYTASAVVTGTGAVNSFMTARQLSDYAWLQVSR